MMPTHSTEVSQVGNGNDVATVEPKGSGSQQGPVFEMVVLGSGGGPLETDCSGCVNLLSFQRVAGQD